MPPALFQAQLNFQRQRIREQRAREAEHRQRRAYIEQTEAAENQAIADAVFAHEPDQGRRLVVVLPQGANQPDRLSSARRDRYKDHLKHILAEATACASIADLPRDQHYDAPEQRKGIDTLLARHPRLAQLCDRLCGQCQGGCCAQGADHAYLSAVSMRRQLDANPELNAEHLLHAYLERLPEESMTGACINQTATGCALPRELRSDICNGYFCPELKVLQQGWDKEQQQPHRLLAIQRAHTNWNRFETGDINPVVAVAWVSGDGVRAAAVPPKPGGD